MYISLMIYRVYPTNQTLAKVATHQFRNGPRRANEINSIFNSSVITITNILFIKQNFTNNEFIYAMIRNTTKANTMIKKLFCLILGELLLEGLGTGEDPVTPAEKSVV
jgi:hypothetical protein